MQERAEACRDSFCQNVPHSPPGLKPDSLAHPAESGLRSCRAEAAPTAQKTQGTFLHLSAFAGHTAWKELGARGWNLTVWITKVIIYPVICADTRREQDLVAGETEAITKRLFSKNKGKRKKNTWVAGFQRWQRAFLFCFLKKKLIYPFTSEIFLMMSRKTKQNISRYPPQRMSFRAVKDRNHLAA